MLCVKLGSVDLTLGSMTLTEHMLIIPSHVGQKIIIPY